MPEECRVACRGEDKRAASYASEYMPAGAVRTLRRAQGSAVARECAHGHRHATHQPTRNHTDKLNRRQLDALGHRLIDLDLDSGSAGQVQGVQMSSRFLHTFCMCSEAVVHGQVCRASPSSSARTIAGDPICFLSSKCKPAKWVANRVRRHSC